MKNAGPGWDGISARIVKLSYKYFLVPLVHICTLSLIHGVFPNELKIAKVIPLYKGGNARLFVNYRPVSVLSIFSKIYERLMYNRLSEFIELNDILYRLQFGFRKRHSTSVALMVLTDKITKALNDGEYVLGVFLVKAFDLVNHEILLRKLYCYGIRGVAHDWLKSYLSNRYQYVVYNEVESSRKKITCGVPQGSILGLLLFLIYINDMASVSDALYPILFADDSNVFLSGRNCNNLISTMNFELVKITEWLESNRLSLNVSKTHYMLFKSKGMHVPITTEDVLIKGVKIDYVRKTKFLGVMVDDMLSWGDHIQYIRGKICKGLSIICKTRKFVNKQTLITLYYCFIYPYLTYSIEVWGLTFKTYLTKLMTLQKKIVRIVGLADRNAHTDPLFQEYKIMQLMKIHAYKVALAMYQVKLHHAPLVFVELFQENEQVHPHNTRQSDHFHVPAVNTDYMKRCIRYKGVIIWNYVSKHVTYDCSFISFKKALKHWILLDTSHFINDNIN